MIKFILTLVSALLATQVAADCQVNPDVLGADYRIERHNAGKSPPEREKLSLWRLNNQVAQIRADAGITDTWRWLPNGQVRQVRYFDAHQRAIEFDAGRDEWSSRSQLLSSQALARMELVSVRGEGCMRTEKYLRVLDKGRLEVQWNPSLRLLVSLELAKPGVSTRMNLTDIHTERQQVSAEFEQRLAYQTTDYADIGDNESDRSQKKLKAESSIALTVKPA